LFGHFQLERAGTNLALLREKLRVVTFLSVFKMLILLYKNRQILVAGKTWYSFTGCGDLGEVGFETEP
jgi:hypothetical protein